MYGRVLQATENLHICDGKNKEGMKKFFNMIPGDHNCCILLYGDIGDYSDGVRSADVVKELMEMEAEYGHIDVRINSNGGDVYAGISIFNALRNSRADITIYIDGIAASMASVIAFCGKPVFMSRYARLMVHSIEGGAYGNKEALDRCIKEIESLEDILAGIYADRCHRTKEEIKATYFDGAEHWLTAQQALDMGFIDGIYDTEPLPEGSTPQQIYATFQNRLSNHSNNNQIMYEELRKRPSFANCASDEEVLQRISMMEAEAAKVPGLTTEVENLRAKNKVFEDKAKEAEEAEIKAVLDRAEKEERITPAQRPTFNALLHADRTNGEAALKALKPKKRIMEDIHRNEPENESPWDKRMKEIREKNI